MPEENILLHIGAFVEQARVANDKNKVKKCVDDAFKNSKAGHRAKVEVIHMLTTAVVSYSMQQRADCQNLFQVFIELEQRKPR